MAARRFLWGFSAHRAAAAVCFFVSAPFVFPYIPMYSCFPYVGGEGGLLG